MAEQEREIDKAKGGDVKERESERGTKEEISEGRAGLEKEAEEEGGGDRVSE